MPTSTIRANRAVVTIIAFLVGFVATPAWAQRGVAGAGVVSRSWTVGGVRRTGLVAAPSVVDSLATTRGVPLVFVFHGHGGTSLNISRTFGVHAQWPEAMVVYLQGLPAPGRVVDPNGVRPGWQGAPGELGDRDLALFDTVLAWAKRERKIDPDRIYAAGHSNGALFTYVLWAKRGDVFAAFAPASAVFSTMIASAKPKPALIIAGKNDALVPYAAQLRSLQSTLRLNQADSVGSAWSANAELHRSPIGAEVVAYLHPGAHPLPPDAAALAARFFKTHSRAKS